LNGLGPRQRTSGFGTHSPFAALQKSGSYWGFYCRAFTIARRVRFDLEPALDGGVNGKEFVGSSEYYEQTRAARS